MSNRAVRALMLTLVASVLLAGLAIAIPRCGTFRFWTDANGCQHERYVYRDCETGEWLGTVEVVYC